ncbi:MAG TPA: response regulator transcription factor [Tepidisphaeraceae bacterium]|nr:response regulator transcription factor [Tepidisphaeraceae bacterium]
MAGQSNSGVRVLIAEDHPSLGKSMAEGLREEGYRVDLAPDGLEAEKLLAGNQYAALVLDLILPGKEGLTLLKEMRQKGDATPVMCVTARDALDDRVLGLDLGADDYLVKPFAWDELLARLRALIRRERGNGRTKVSVGDLEIDLVKRSVARSGKIIHLTVREFMLLQYLAARQGQVVSRSEISRHLYGQDDEASSNVVDVYIGYLRSKIDKPYDRKLIHTHRGAGYEISAATTGGG